MPLTNLIEEIISRAKSPRLTLSEWKNFQISEGVKNTKELALHLKATHCEDCSINITDYCKVDIYGEAGYCSNPHEKYFHIETYRPHNYDISYQTITIPFTKHCHGLAKEYRLPSVKDLYLEEYKVGELTFKSSKFIKYKDWLAYFKAMRDTNYQFQKIVQIYVPDEFTEQVPSKPGFKPYLEIKGCPHEPRKILMERAVKKLKMACAY